VKITIELTRAEALELNHLIQQGKAVTKPSRTTFRVFALWNEAYLKAMSE